MFQAIFLGHPEVLVVALLVFGGPLSGVAAVIKPYAAAPLLAEKPLDGIPGGDASSCS